MTSRRRRKGRALRGRTVVVAAAVLAPMLVAVPALGAGSSGQDGSMPAFTESSGCAPPNHKPQAHASGWLPNSAPIRGPMANFVGRSIGAVRNQLVWWDVPMSDGERIQVHERALPAFQRVAENLAVEEAAGRYYPIRSAYTYGFAPRTISGRYTYSYHAFGTAIDINATTNPLRRDGVLVTNMPQWFVDAWTEAGFCWGGYWKDSKDAMHFAWMGPAYTPGYGDVPDAQPVVSSPGSFDARVRSTGTPFGGLRSDRHYLIADGSGDGAVDVVQLHENPWGVVIEYSRAGDLHSSCSVRRDHAAEAVLAERTALLGDHGGSGRNDLWTVDGSSGEIALAIHTKSDDFATRLEFATGLAAQPDDVYLVGDYDGDWVADLFVVRRNAGTTSLEVRLGPDYGDGPAELATPLGDSTAAGWHFATGDRDLDGASDLVALDPGGLLAILLAADGYGVVAESHDVPPGSGITAMAMSDYDGDGRTDLHVLRDDGTFDAYLGNRTAYSDADDWFAGSGTCDADDPVYGHDGTFRDDDFNVHESNIEAIAARDITRGCNPPYGDEYCPSTVVTRGQMAAFLVRMLGLDGPVSDNRFTDDDDSIFEADIERLAAAGITTGCNPPANDHYCPDRAISRAEFAAFLARALGLTDRVAGNRFLDDDGSIFEPAIETLAEADITRGCNPPANDLFCPTMPVRRDQMASFLERSARLLDARQ